MNRNCSVCNIKIDKNYYLKDRTVCKCCNNKNRRKKKILLLTNNQKSKTLRITKTMSTTLVFQHMKTTAMFLLDHPTSVKLITCSKYLEK